MAAKFIDNAKVIHSPDELPKIGERYFDNTATCYSLEAYEDEKHPDFIFYKAYFSERLNTKNQKYFIFGVDCFIFTYAIKISEL